MGLSQLSLNCFPVNVHVLCFQFAPPSNATINNSACSYVYFQFYRRVLNTELYIPLCVNKYRQLLVQKEVKILHISTGNIQGYPCPHILGRNRYYRSFKSAQVQWQNANMIYHFYLSCVYLTNSESEHFSWVCGSFGLAFLRVVCL